MLRREFLRLCGAAATAFALPAEVARFDYPWKLGVITDEVSLDLAQVLRDFIPTYGLRWAEIRELTVDGQREYVYKNATPAQLKQISKQLADAGVHVSVLDTAIYKITLPGTTPVGADAADLNPNNGAFANQMEELKRAADAAHFLETDKLRVFTFKRVADPNTVFAQVVENLEKALETARKHDVNLLVENEFDCNVGTGTETARLFRAIPNRRLMHNWDPGNCFKAGEQPFPKAWDQLDKSRIRHIHLKDASQAGWRPIGGGDIDFVGQFKALKAMRYGYTLSLETHYKNAQNDPYTSSVESMDGLVKVLKEV